MVLQAAEKPESHEFFRKLAWEDELWDEFSAKRYAASQIDNTIIYPVIGIVGQIRAGLGEFAPMKDDKAAQDSYIASLRGIDTNWYDLLSATPSLRGITFH